MWGGLGSEREPPSGTTRSISTGQHTNGRITKCGLTDTFPPAPVPPDDIPSLEYEILDEPMHANALVMETLLVPIERLLAGDQVREVFGVFGQV